jgi:hypothetical protein
MSDPEAADPLCDSGLEYAARLRAAGRPVQLGEGGRVILLSTVLCRRQCSAVPVSVPIVIFHKNENGLRFTDPTTLV